MKATIATKDTNTLEATIRNDSLLFANTHWGFTQAVEWLVDEGATAITYDITQPRGNIKGLFKVDNGEFVITAGSEFFGD